MSEAIVYVKNTKRLFRRCRRCGKRWCGTDLKLIELYGHNYSETHPIRATFGSKECGILGSER